MATILCYLLTVQIWVPLIRYNFQSSVDSIVLDGIIFYGSGTLAIFLSGLFILRWDKGTAALAPKVMAFTVPFLSIGLAWQQAYGVMVCGIIGLVCFFWDRKGFGMTHPLWVKESTLFRDFI